MKRFMIVSFVVLLVALCLSLAHAQASIVTLSFDPNDLIDLYPADYNGSKTTQENARRVHYTWGTNYYGTFNDYMQSGHSQPTDYNTYVAWRSSLDEEGEGIAVFNSWLVDDVNAPTWGEKYVIKSGSTVTATSQAGWGISYILNPYGLGGACVQFYTLDPTLRLRPGGADIGNFTITADIYIDNNTNGVFDSGDEEVETGDTIRMWFGNLNGDDPGFYRSDTQALYFDDATYCTAAGQGGSGFEAAMSVTAVPEPATLLIWSLLGILGAVTYWWRRK